MTTRRPVAALLQQGWIATQPGALAEARPAVQPNDLYDTASAADLLRRTDLRPLSEAVRPHLRRAALHRPRRQPVVFFAAVHGDPGAAAPMSELSDGARAPFYQRYYDTIAAEKAKRGREARQAGGQGRAGAPNTMQPLLISHLCHRLEHRRRAGGDPGFVAVRRQRSASVPFATAELPTYVGEIDALADFKLPEALAAFDCRNNRLAEMALGQDGFEAAVAGCEWHATAPRRIGLFLGTSTSGILQAELAYRARDTAYRRACPQEFDYQRTHNVASLAGYLRQRLGIAGPSFVVSCACASTAKAFGNAARMIEAGLCDAAIVGGADTLCLTTLYGFHALALNAPGPCRPFDAARDGISIGEAAGFALLEKPQRGRWRDAVMLLGVGESNDALSYVLAASRAASAHGWQWNAR